MLTQKARDDIRYHLRVPAIGMLDGSLALGLRFSTVINTLEYRMTNLTILEEADLAGFSIGSVQIMGVNQVGDTITISIGNLSPMTYIVTQADINAQKFPVQNQTTLYSIAQNIAQQWNMQNSSQYVASAGPALLGHMPLMLPNFSEVIFSNPLGSPFKITASSTGSTFAYPSQQGMTTKFNFAFVNSDGITTTNVYGLINICNWLDVQVNQAAQNYSFIKAGQVEWNVNEVNRREELYERWVIRLSDFLGVKVFPTGNKNGSGGFVI